MMRKLGKLSSAVILGTLLCLTVFCTGAFAESAGYSATGAVVQSVMVHAGQQVNADTHNQGVVRSDGWGRGRWFRHGRGVRSVRFGRFGGFGRGGRSVRFGRFGGFSRGGRSVRFGRFGGFSRGGRAFRAERVTRSTRVTRIIRVVRTKITRVVNTLRITRLFHQTRFRSNRCGGGC